MLDALTIRYSIYYWRWFTHFVSTLIQYNWGLWPRLTHLVLKSITRYTGNVYLCFEIQYLGDLPFGGQIFWIPRYVGWARYVQICGKSRFFGCLDASWTHLALFFIFWPKNLTLINFTKQSLGPNPRLCHVIFHIDYWCHHAMWHPVNGSTCHLEISCLATQKF